MKHTQEYLRKIPYNEVRSFVRCVRDAIGADVIKLLACVNLIGLWKMYFITTNFC
jgi:hypothetical protein